MRFLNKMLSVAMPQNIRKLPRDDRGLPVPASVAYDADGKPDFRVIDLEMWPRLVLEQRCGICGRKMHGRFAFVGGPKSLESRYFSDAPMHHECASYALRVCPFLAAPRFMYAAKLPNPPGLEIRAISDNVQRPEYFGLGITDRYALIDPGQAILQAGKWINRVVWFKEGKVYEPK